MKLPKEIYVCRHSAGIDSEPATQCYWINTKRLNTNINHVCYIDDKRCNQVTYIQKDKPCET